MCKVVCYVAQNNFRGGPWFKLLVVRLWHNRHRFKTQW